MRRLLYSGIIFVLAACSPEDQALRDAERRIEMLRRQDGFGGTTDSTEFRNQQIFRNTARGLTVCGEARFVTDAGYASPWMAFYASPVGDEEIDSLSLTPFEECRFAQAHAFHCGHPEDYGDPEDCLALIEGH